MLRHWEGMANIMIYDIFNIFTEQVFPTVINWAERAYYAIGNALPIIIAMFCVALTTRFLIMPVISGKLSSGSDKARSKKE